MRLPREFNIGDVLSLGFVVWGRNFATFIGVSALVHVPLMGFIFWVRTRFDIDTFETETPEEALDIVWTFLKVMAVWTVIQWLLNGILLAATVYGAVKVLRGDTVTIGGCLNAAFSRILPVLAVTFIVTMCTIVGTFALIVPGIYIAVIWWVAVPVVMSEHRSIGEALNRSVGLIKGYGWQVFGLLVILGLLNFGVGALAEAITQFIPSERNALLGIGDLVGAVVGSSISAVMVGVAYLVLRVTKEGFQTEDLESVFE